MNFLAKIFKDPNQRIIDGLMPKIEEINRKETEISKLSDAEIKNRYLKIKKEVTEKSQDIRETNKETLKNKIQEILDEYLIEVFALTREAAKRTIGQRHFDVQLLGGIVLHQGKIAEMKTGEGKTLVATLAASLNALAGRGVHIVTVNDYLARRDAGWMGRIYNFLGLSVSSIVHEKAYIFDEDFKNEQVIDEKTEHLREISREEAYLCDITYGTNNEYGFDYLRDNMAQTKEQMVQRDLYYAIVDEVDSILIDEARTPLIISAPAEEATEKYYHFAKLVKKLKKDKDYLVDEKHKAATLTDEGIATMEKMLGVENIYEAYGIENVHHIEQALKAEALFKRDRDYVVKDGEIIIVDEFTGRLMFGRRYSEGLHQAIEAKEGVPIKQESITLATISFQNYFRLYTKIAGMTGTAATEAEEFHKIYNLEVVVIPTNKPMIREDYPDVIYKSEKAKLEAVVAEIKEMQKKGRPVLVGTVSIEKNELLSDLLKRAGVKHEVLNAKNHEKEAMIIARAGEHEAVTVATNMAGRGTDIILDKKAKKAGGLHVIGTERHESRRIDNQLRGRSGRQGDPGSSKFFVSLEDDLMRIFGSDRVKIMMERLGLPDDTPIQHPLISKSLEQAQKRVESQNFDIRKHLVEYDDVINKQREYVYAKRRLAIESDSIRENVLEYIKNESQNIALICHNEQTDEIDKEKVIKILDSILPGSQKNLKIKADDVDSLAKEIKDLLIDAYQEKEKTLGPNVMRLLEKAVYLNTIDKLWVDHIDAMDHLREGIGLRGYGQKDPLIEYKNESHRMFNTFKNALQTEFINILFRAEIKEEPAQNQLNEVEKENILLTSNKVRGKKIGRNDPCWCGSGKKYKKCHGRNN